MAAQDFRDAACPACCFRCAGLYHNWYILMRTRWAALSSMPPCLHGHLVTAGERLPARLTVRVVAHGKPGHRPARKGEQQHVGELRAWPGRSAACLGAHTTQRHHKNAPQYLHLPSPGLALAAEAQVLTLHHRTAAEPQAGRQACCQAKQPDCTCAAWAELPGSCLSPPGPTHTVHPLACFFWPRTFSMCS